MSRARGGGVRMSKARGGGVWLVLRLPGVHVAGTPCPVAAAAAAAAAGTKVEEIHVVTCGEGQ